MEILEEHLESLIRIALILFIGLPLLFVGTRLLRKFVTRKLSAHFGMIIANALFYIGIIIILVTVLADMGFQIGALLGAAGIAGVAIGFASQTSLSNIISGLFTITEKPFAIGDAIQVGETRGLVERIGLLSINLRTFDNQFVRIPNETIIKSQVTTITRYPIRRLDIKVGVAYKEDIAKVMKILRDVANKNPYCLDEPEPLILFTDFADSSLSFLFGVWFSRTDMLLLRNSIMREIKEAFDAEGIEIPFPHRTLYSGEATQPFPIRLVKDDPIPEAPTEKGE
ncbi:MAG: mechanosensitive ion channel family protein [Opitutales bacterium]|nr:mechanosensitive ion channel family protein [Opitutales bacterium]